MTRNRHMRPVNKRKTYSVAAAIAGGRKAAKSGRELSACPYHLYSTLRKYWVEAYENELARQRLRRELREREAS